MQYDELLFSLGTFLFTIAAGILGWIIYLSLLVTLSLTFCYRALASIISILIVDISLTGDGSYLKGWVGAGFIILPKGAMGKIFYL